MLATHNGQLVIKMTNYEDLNEVDRQIIKILQPSEEKEVEKNTVDITSLIDGRKRPYVSQRLSYLREKDIVEKRKEGRENLYKIKNVADSFSEKVAAIQKIKDFSEETSFDDIEIENIYTSASLSQGFGLDKFGFPEEVELENIKIPEEDLKEDNSALNLLLVILEEVMEKSEKYWRRDLEEIYERLAREKFEEEELEEVLEKKETLLDFMMQNTRYYLGGVEINLYREDSEVQLYGDSLAQVLTHKMSSDRFPDVEESKLSELLRELEDKYRDMKKLQLVLRSF